MKRRRTLKPVGHEITEKIALIYEKLSHPLENSQNAFF